MDARTLDEWEVKVLDSIHTKITKKNLKCKNPRKRYVLSNRTCKDYLENFKKSFVLVPADKASNTILIVCRIYYLDVVHVLKEGLTASGP